MNGKKEKNTLDLKENGHGWIKKMNDRTEKIIVRTIGVLLFIPFLGCILIFRDFREYYLNTFFDIGPYSG